MRKNRSGPRSAKALTGDFQWCTDAGLPPDCTLHGLRHTGAHLSAEAEATARQIMAITGHRTLALSSTIRATPRRRARPRRQWRSGARQGRGDDVS
jgi:integrase